MQQRGRQRHALGYAYCDECEGKRRFDASKTARGGDGGAERVGEHEHENRLDGVHMHAEREQCRPERQSGGDVLYESAADADCRSSC